MSSETAPLPPPESGASIFAAAGAVALDGPAAHSVVVLRCACRGAHSILRSAAVLIGAGTRQAARSGHARDTLPRMRARSAGRSSRARKQVPPSVEPSSILVGGDDDASTDDEADPPPVASFPSALPLLVPALNVAADGSRAFTRHGRKHCPDVSSIQPAVVGVRGWYRQTALHSPIGYSSFAWAAEISGTAPPGRSHSLSTYRSGCASSAQCVAVSAGVNGFQGVQVDGKRSGEREP